MPPNRLCKPENGLGVNGGVFGTSGWPFRNKSRSFPASEVSKGVFSWGSFLPAGRA
jgi:hypothetical protein